MSQPPAATSQQRSASAGNYPSSTASTSSGAAFASTSANTTPLLGQGTLNPISPASSLLPSSPYAGGFASSLHSPAATSFAHTSSYAAQSTSSSRRLIWEGTIPICVSVDPTELPPGSDSTITETYIVAPRISYLPLVVADVRKNLLELALEGPALVALNEKDMWFEYEGQPLRWHWQIGLLYDYHTSNPARTSISYQVPSTATSGLGSLRSETPQPQDRTASSVGQISRLPWKIKLRLSKPPVERLHSNAGLESCKTSFMSMMKEADFVRYGSTKKVTNLRKQEQDTLWESVVSHNYDLFWSVANKLVPNVAVSSVDSSGLTATPGRSSITSRTLSSIWVTIDRRHQYSAALRRKPTNLKQSCSQHGLHHYEHLFLRPTYTECR